MVPVCGGIVGAYLGYDNLNERLETTCHRAHIEAGLDQWRFL